MYAFTVKNQETPGYKNTDNLGFLSNGIICVCLLHYVHYVLNVVSVSVLEGIFTQSGGSSV